MAAFFYSGYNGVTDSGSDLPPQSTRSQDKIYEAAALLPDIGQEAVQNSDKGRNTANEVSPTEHRAGRKNLNRPQQIL